MSAAHPWPEGVPELPGPPIERFALWAGQWWRVHYLAEDTAQAGAPEEVAHNSKNLPRCSRFRDAIVGANAAARALGIIPHGESASGASLAGADGEGKDA